MAAERNVSLDSDWLAGDGGHGKRDLSVLMRVDSPAARITAAKLGARDIEIVDCRFRIADWKPPGRNWQSEIED
jgi:hypothetical protein